MELVHTGWDGELELRERYDSGWTGVLDLYGRTLKEPKLNAVEKEN